MFLTSGGCANLGAVLACTDTGLTNGQIYYYFVMAVNSVGPGPPNEVSVTPVATCALTCSADVPGSGVAGALLSFVVSSSSSSSCAGAVGQSWTFGDGTTGSGSSVTHAYSTAGVFNWTLTVSQSGSTCVRNGSLSIGSATSGLPTIDYLRANRDQIAVGGTSDLTWNVRNASTVIFQGFGNVAANSGITVAPTDTTTYKLIATNSAGSQTATSTVRVDSILNVSIRADQIAGPMPLDVSFTTLVSGGVPPYRYQWSFGDTSAQTTHRWATATPEDVSCAVTDARGSVQTSNILQIVASSMSAGIQLEFFDQKPTNLVAACPYCRNGASADGVTTVEVRATTAKPGFVRFSFVRKLDGVAHEGPDADGGLYPTIASTGLCAASATVHSSSTSGTFVASAFYHVPDDFNGTTDDEFERILDFSAHLAGDDGSVGDIKNIAFHLRRTPVVFVHGIWGSASTWSDLPLASELVARRDATYSTWDGTSSIRSGATQARHDFDLALYRRRMDLIAASRVDVVAHSMGGLITKQIAAGGYDGSKADDSTMVHKLITLDTPHFGSALADFIVANRNDFFIKHFFLPHFPIDTGAADDLRITAGGASARALSTGSLRAHSIVGIASDDEPCDATVNVKNRLPELVTWLCGELHPESHNGIVSNYAFGFPFSTVDECKRWLLTRVLNNHFNDEIVDDESQRGGLSSAVSRFDSGSATGQHRCVAAHMNVTSNDGVSRRVKTLLNQSAVTGPFEGYALPPTSVINRTLSTEGESTFALSFISRRPTASEAISVSAPIDGQVVNPGDAIEVSVMASPAFTKAFVATPDQIASTSVQPFRARIDIPATAIGQYTIGVRADTATGDSATASITLNVTPNALVASLVVRPLEFFLNVGDTVKPRVSGVFADGVTRDLSRSTTVVFASSDPSVVSALPDGTLKATGAGIAWVTVSADAASAEVLINVTLFCYTLSTGVISDGMGSVTVNTASNCTGGYTANTEISLTANPLSGYTFTGWSGSGGTFSSSSANPTTFTITGSASVTATFTLNPQTLTVTKVGTGTGTVTSSPSGISCGATCSAAFNSGLVVTLMASADAGSSFTGWSGDCAGSGVCQVTMSQARTVTATVTVAPAGPAGLFYTLTPCRVLDTRNPTGPLGAPSLQPYETRNLNVAGVCGVPSDAIAISANLTVTNVGATGELVVFPSDILRPNTSVVSFRPGRARANNSIVSFSKSGTTFSVFNNSAATVDFIVDVNGVFR